jgi:hypothetical protein
MEVSIIRQTRYKSCNGGNCTESGDGAFTTPLTFNMIPHWQIIKNEAYINLFALFHKLYWAPVKNNALANNHSRTHRFCCIVLGSEELDRHHKFLCHY